MCVYVCMYLFMCVFIIYVYSMYVCLRMYVYMYVCVHVYVYNTYFIKVKLSRYRPGVAQRVGRGIALLFYDPGTRRG